MRTRIQRTCNPCWNCHGVRSYPQVSMANGWIYMNIWYYIIMGVTSTPTGDTISWVWNWECLPRLEDPITRPEECYPAKAHFSRIYFVCLPSQWAAKDSRRFTQSPLWLVKLQHFTKIYKNQDQNPQKIITQPSTPALKSWAWLLRSTGLMKKFIQDVVKIQGLLGPAPRGIKIARQCQWIGLLGKISLVETHAFWPSNIEVSG